MKKTSKKTRRPWWWKSYLRTIRYCVTCGGKLKNVFVGSEHVRRHVCPKCKRITYLNPRVVAGFIPVMPDGRVVLLKRDIEPAKGKWTFPAGYQEMGEKCEEAAARETWEESVLRVKVESLVGVYSYYDGGVVTVVYTGKISKNQKPQAGHEMQDVKCFLPKDIPWEDLAFTSVVDALRDWKKMKKRGNKK